MKNRVSENQSGNSEIDQNYLMAARQIQSTLPQASANLGTAWKMVSPTSPHCGPKENLIELEGSRTNPADAFFSYANSFIESYKQQWSGSVIACVANNRLTKIMLGDNSQQIQRALLIERNPSGSTTGLTLVSNTGNGFESVVTEHYGENGKIIRENLGHRKKNQATGLVFSVCTLNADIDPKPMGITAPNAMEENLLSGKITVFHPDQIKDELALLSSEWRTLSTEQAEKNDLRNSLIDSLSLFNRQLLSDSVVSDKEVSLARTNLRLIGIAQRMNDIQSIMKRDLEVIGDNHWHPTTNVRAIIALQCGEEGNAVKASILSSADPSRNQMAVPPRFYDIYGCEKDGVITKKIQLNDAGEVISVSSFERDENGRVTKKQTVSGKLKKVQDFQYGSTGRISAELVVDSLLTPSSGSEQELQRCSIYRDGKKRTNNPETVPAGTVQNAT